MLRKIAAYLPSTVIPILVNFVLVFIYASCMEPGPYGVYNVYLNSISIIYALAQSFLQSSALRFYSIKGMCKDEREYYSTYYYANLAISAALAVILAVVSLLLQFDWVVIVFAVATNALYQFDLNVQRLRDKPAQYTFSRLSASFGALAFIGVCIASFGQIDFRVPIYTFYGAYLFTIVAEFARCAKYLSVRSVSKRLLIESVKFGMPMMGVTVVGLLISYSSQYVILILLSEDAVGFYSLGFRLSDTVISNITMIILTVMTPVVMRVYDESGKDKVSNGSRMLTTLINLDIWVVLPVCVLLALYSEDLIRLLFPSYEGAESIVQIIVFSAVLNSLSMITCKGLELACETSKILEYLVISLVVNLAYTLIFVPVYGIDAAGHASIASYLVYNILLIRRSRTAVPIVFDVAYLAKVCVLSVVLAGVIFAFKALIGTSTLLLLVIQGCICVLFYLVASLILGLYKPFLGGFGIGKGDGVKE